MEQEKGMLVGLTGPTGAGKTQVSKILREKGYTVIDADMVARDVVEKGKKCLVDLVIEFGLEILNADGTLNREKLGDIVFRDKQKRQALNRITFAYIQEEIFDRVAHLYNCGNSVVFLDAPTLIESGTDKDCGKVVSILAPPEDRFLRILRRDNLNEKQVRNRMRSQHDDDFYTSQSDFVINNTGDFNELRKKVMEMLEAIGILSKTDSAGDVIRAKP